MVVVTAPVVLVVVRTVVLVEVVVVVVAFPPIFATKASEQLPTPLPHALCSEFIVGKLVENVTPLT